MLVAAVVAALLRAVARTPALGRARLATAAAGAAAVAGLSAWLAESGALAPRPGLQPVLLYVAGCNLGALALPLGPWGRALAASLPPAWWVLFQGFRLPLEVILHLWHRAGTLPERMTWQGENLDLASGASALLLGLWCLRMGAALPAWIAHAVGLTLLANVARVAIGSFPHAGPPQGDALLLPFHAPYTWILPFGVSAALFAHVVGLRALLHARASR